MGTVVKKMYADKLNPRVSYGTQFRAKIRAIVKDMEDYLYEHQFVSWLLKVTAAAFVLFILGALLYAYNVFSKLHTSVLVSYAQIGVEIKRRDNLIPNLIIATKKYSVYEQETFKYISETKELLVQTKSMKENAKYSSQLDSALSRLLAIAEQYPDLKATQSMQDLIKELSNTENRIAEQKMEYNRAIYRYNSLLTEFPTNLLGKLYGFWPPFEYHSVQKDEIEKPELLSEWGREITKLPDGGIVRGAGSPAEPPKNNETQKPETVGEQQKPVTVKETQIPGAVHKAQKY